MGNLDFSASDYVVSHIWVEFWHPVLSRVGKFYQASPSTRQPKHSIFKSCSSAFSSRKKPTVTDRLPRLLCGGLPARTEDNWSIQTFSNFRMAMAGLLMLSRIRNYIVQIMVRLSGQSTCQSPENSRPSERMKYIDLPIKMQQLANQTGIRKCPALRELQGQSHQQTQVLIKTNSPLHSKKQWWKIGRYWTAAFCKLKGRNFSFHTMTSRL